MNIIYFVLILMGLVVIHEAGHMVVAKACGMRVERFMLFMGKPLVSFTRGETEYGIGWLPLGGYVKISGMTREEEIPPEVEHRAYYAATTWRKVATIFAGPAVNIVLAFVLFAAIFWVGAPTAGDPTTVIGQVERNSPAAAIDLRPGDRLVSIDGVRATSGSDVTRLREELRRQPDEPVTVVYARDGQRVEKTVTTRAVEDGGQRVGQLGFTFEQTVYSQQYGFVDGITMGGRLTWVVIEATGQTVGQLFVSSEARDQLNSVVGAGAVFNEVANEGTVRILQFAALLSLALGVFNLLPLFPLDGGHILFALIEKVRGVALGRAAYERASVVGIALILLVFFIALENDITLIRDGVNLQR